MWRAFAKLGFRYNRVRLALWVAAALGLLGPTACFLAAFGQDSERTKTRYLPIATIPYERVDLRGTDAGFTVARMPAQEPTKTRLVVSWAFAVERPKVQNLRLVAKDRAGKLHLPNDQIIAAATGQQRRVITLLCEFSVPEQDIRELVVERSVLVGEVDLGMVKARLIIDEDEEEQLPSGYNQ